MYMYHVCLPAHHNNPQRVKQCPSAHIRHWVKILRTLCTLKKCRAATFCEDGQVTIVARPWAGSFSDQFHMLQPPGQNKTFPGQGSKLQKKKSACPWCKSAKNSLIPWDFDLSPDLSYTVNTKSYWYDLFAHQFSLFI